MLSTPSCQTVFRARPTTFACLTWFALFLVWKMIDMRRSFFQIQPGSKKYLLTPWAIDFWRTQFLFCPIILGFVTLFPLIYIPALNTVVSSITPSRGKSYSSPRVSSSPVLSRGSGLSGYTSAARVEVISVWRGRTWTLKFACLASTSARPNPSRRSRAPRSSEILQIHVCYLLLTSTCQSRLSE